MKKFLILIIACIMLFSFGVNSASDITVKVDGEAVEFDVAPRLIGGRTMVPLRAIFEAIGAVVEWEEETQTVTAYNEAYLVKSTIGNTIITVNGQEKTMDIAPMIVDSRTLVPARFVAEAFNCDVQWSAENMTVYITTAEIDYSQMEKPSNVQTNTPQTNITTAVSQYYPEINIPTYTSVTGIELLKISETGTYYYNLTSDVFEYIKTLQRLGWEIYEKKEFEDGSVSYFLIKDFEMICVSLEFSINQVWILW